MRIYTKIIEGFNMEGYNDSNVNWVIRSRDRDGTPRSCTYKKKHFTLKASFDLHNRLYKDM